MLINGLNVDIRADDLTVIEELGRGAYGVVEKVSLISHEYCSFMF